jgi:hypothetical protein
MSEYLTAENIIWLSFFLIFSALAIYHFKISRLAIAHIETNISGGAVSGVPMVKGGGELTNELNSYIDEVNGIGKKQNRIAGFGYVVAALTALFSMFL